MSVVTAWWFGVYHLLPVCHMSLEVRIKFLASDYYLISVDFLEATTELNKLLVHIMITVMKILHL